MTFRMTCSSMTTFVRTKAIATQEYTRRCRESAPAHAASRHLDLGERLCQLLVRKACGERGRDRVANVQICSLGNPHKPRADEARARPRRAGAGATLLLEAPRPGSG